MSEKETPKSKDIQRLLDHGPREYADWTMLHIRFSASDSRMIDEICERLGSTKKSEVVRTAVRVYHAILLRDS